MILSFFFFREFKSVIPLKLFLSVLSCCCCFIAQSYLTLCDCMNCSPPGFSVQGIPQARILEWVPISSSRGSLRHREGTCLSYISCIGSWFLYFSCCPGSPGILLFYFYYVEMGIFHLPRGISPNPPSKVTTNQEFYWML